MSDETWVVTLPKLGESVTEGVIGSVFKQVGDEVEFDDPLFEVSTDKVDSEVPSPYDGVVLEVLAQPGETIPVGARDPEDRRQGHPGGEPAAVRRTRGGRGRWPVAQRSRRAVGGRIRGPVNRGCRTSRRRPVQARSSRSPCRNWANQ